MVPHGVAYEEFKAASAAPPPEMRISKGAVAFMFESSRPFTITEWAWTSGKKHEHEPKMWYVVCHSQKSLRYGVNANECN